MTSAPNQPLSRPLIGHNALFIACKIFLIFAFTAALLLISLNFLTTTTISAGGNNLLEISYFIVFGISFVSFFSFFIILTYIVFDRKISFELSKIAFITAIISMTLVLAFEFFLLPTPYTFLKTDNKQIYLYVMAVVTIMLMFLAINGFVIVFDAWKALEEHRYFSQKTFLKNVKIGK